MPEIPPAATRETSDISVRAALYFGISLVLGVTLLAVIVGWMELRLDHSSRLLPHQPMADGPEFTSPSPALQLDPVADLNALRGEEDKVLHTYGWVDRKAGWIRIPLDRAMELTLQRGLPQTGTTMPLPGTPQDASGNSASAAAPSPPTEKGGTP